MTKPTDTQRLALAYLETVPFAGPSALGDVVAPGGTSARHSGGAVGRKLVKYGWATNLQAHQGKYPQYQITEAGREFLRGTTVRHEEAGLPSGDGTTRDEQQNIDIQFGPKRVNPVGPQ